MARVVQRRSNPPYLLIVFVFLFLVSTIVAVMMYLDKTKADKTVASLQVDKTKQADDITKLTGQNGELASIIVGQKNYEAAKKADTDMRSELSISLPSLVSAVTDYVQKNAELVTQLKGKSEELTLAKADLFKSAENIKSAQDQYDKQSEQLKAENAKLLADWNKFQQDQKVTLDNLKDVSKREAEALQKQLAIFQDDIGKKNIEIARLYTRIDDLTTKIGEYRPKLDPDNMARIPKGKVADVAVDAKTVYLNKGSRHGMSPGLTFAVLSPGAKAPKAVVQVMTVRENISEARITQGKSSDPVTAGDDIVNPAFNPGRTYSFVVRGLFDVDGKGKPTAQGAEMVKEVIRKAGGKVLDDVTATTDWSVLGEAPELPPKPEEDASPQEKLVWEMIRTSLDDYNRVQGETLKWRIPNLNANRFVALMGFGLEKP